MDQWKESEVSYADYTCGPAAAVTALRKLGFPAEEGQIGILSCTSYEEGTPVDMLADGLKTAYGKDGLQIECRTFKSIAELRSLAPTLALTKYSLMVDHWLTVLEVTDSEVIVADVERLHPTVLCGVCKEMAVYRNCAKAKHKQLGKLEFYFEKDTLRPWH